MYKITTILLFVFATTFTFSQTNNSPQNYTDSLQLAKSMVDLLSPAELTKQRERFIYLNRTQPSKINKDVLVYIEEKYKNL
ncbi:MAG: hypothetical protein RI883_103 [Bacteroidota bacterium]|jgi:hypothetical protein